MVDIAFQDSFPVVFFGFNSRFPDDLFDPGIQLTETGFPQADPDRFCHFMGSGNVKKITHGAIFKC
jgi:hypothetical protein